MSDKLQEIMAAKRVEVMERQAATPVERLKEIISSLPKPRNFFQAVTRTTDKRLNLIAEIKKASPSAGVIRSDFDPAAIARIYAEAGADALSVLTDEKYFHGHLQYIGTVRDVVKLPVLRKDFLIDSYQVYESRAAGADAVLLIAEALDTSKMIDMQILATELNMTCLIEVHDLENLMRVRDQVIGFPHRSYSLLGINNRNLRTLNVDLGTTLRMAELVEDKRVLVSESGIRSRSDVEKLAAAGVCAALVGETFMSSEDIGGKVRELFG